MIIVTGVAFLLFAMLEFFIRLTSPTAAFVTGFVFVALGLLIGERPFGPSR